MRDEPTIARRNELAREAMNGDRDALVHLLEIVQPDIRSFARQQCRATDTEDAVQEALWLLYRRVGMLRAAPALPIWLFTVVRRECLKLARYANRVEKHDEDWFEHSRLAPLAPAELRLDVAAALESLPAHYRQIVILRDFEEMTIDEIGASLHLSREAVKGRMRRARSLLREYLRDH